MCYFLNHMVSINPIIQKSYIYQTKTYCYEMEYSGKKYAFSSFF